MTRHHKQRDKRAEHTPAAPADILEPAPLESLPLEPSPFATAALGFETPEGRAVFLLPDAVVCCMEAEKNTVSDPDEDPATTLVVFAGGFSVRVKGDVDSIMDAFLAALTPAAAEEPAPATFRSEAARLTGPGDE